MNQSELEVEILKKAFGLAKSYIDVDNDVTPTSDIFEAFRRYDKYCEQGFKVAKEYLRRHIKEPKKAEFYIQTASMRLMLTNSKRKNELAEIYFKLNHRLN